MKHKQHKFKPNMSAMKTRQIHLKQTLLVLVAFVWAFTGCQQKEDPQPENSAVSTNAPSNVDFTSATLGGSLTKLGTGGVTDHGFVWGETADPDLTAAGKQSLGAKAETGTFTHNATGLTAGVTYHVRAYVTDAQGTFYGQNQTFSTTSSPTITSFTPTEGGQNDTLTVTGTNFSTTISDITVKVGTIAATNIISATTTEIKAIVPSGVTEGANKVTVMIKTQEVISTNDFTYLGGLWTQKKGFGGEPRAGAISFSVNGKGYIGLGSSNNIPVLDDLWEYDPTADTWTQKANYAGGKRVSPVSFVIQNIAFVGLGRDETRTDQKDFWQYNPTTNAWAKFTDFTGTISSGKQFGFSVGGKGYVARANSTDLWEVNLGVWTQKNALPASNLRRYFVLNDVAYVISEDKKLWKYNATMDTWTALQNVPEAMFISSGLIDKGVDSNGKAYLGGSASDNHVIWEYDSGTDTWARKRGVVGLTSSLGYAEQFGLNNKIYFRTGFASANTFWEFDPTK